MNANWFKEIYYGHTTLPQHNELSKKLISTAKPSQAPWFINVVGTVGSGKSTVSKAFSESIETPHTLVRLDAVMEAYPEYHRDINEIGEERAFLKWEPIAWATGFDIMAAVTAMYGNIIFELSGSNLSHPKFLAGLKQHGYKTCMTLVNTSIEVCKARAQQRALVTTRHVPPNYINDRYEAILTLKPKYKEITDLYIEIQNDMDIPITIPVDLLNFILAN